MKKTLVSLVIAAQVSFVVAADGSNYLNNMKGSDIDIKSTISTQKQLDLSDSFLVQLFGSWKAAGALKPEINSWVNLILNKEFEKALKSYSEVLKMTPIKFKKTVKASELYLLHRLGFNSMFVDSWLDLAVNESLLTTEVGLALDHVVGTHTSKWLVDAGVVLTDRQIILLSKLTTTESRVNYSLQAFNALRSGKESLKWIRKIPSNDPLRVELTKSALIDFAKMGELKASAKLIKEVFEPIIEKSKDIDEISNYYLTLARLLYQARAYDASKSYYESIPQKSKYFLSSQTELIWVNLRNSDFPAVKGTLETLSMDLFKDKFHPEIYLVSAISNLKTCQFTQVKNNFKSFMADNKIWAKKISSELKKQNVSLIEKDFYSNNVEKNFQSLNKELAFISTLPDSRYKSTKTYFLNTKISNTKETFELEKRRRWENRMTVLDQAIYKMRFVKIEFISRMRDLSLALQKQYEDQVTTYAAAPTRNNQVKYPHDKVVWADELFNMTAQVENLCIQNKGNK